MGIGELRIAHAMPGRIRLKIDRLKGDAALARDIEQRLSGAAGIREVAANPLTGSLLVLFDAATLADREAVLGLIEPLRAVLPELEPEPLMAWFSSQQDRAPPSPTALMESSVAAVNEYLRRGTAGMDLKLLLPMTLFLLGLRALLGSNKLVLPAWYDFFWFAFSTFFMLNRPQ